MAIFNTFSGERSDEVEVSVDVDPRATASSDYRSFDKNGKFPIRIIDNSEDALKPVPQDVRVYDGEKEIPAKLVSASVENLLITGYEHFPHQYNVNRMKIVFRAEHVPAMGWKVFGVEPLYEKAEAECLEWPEIENEYFAVSVSEDGTLTVTDKANNKTIEGLNRFVDSGDCGDEYTYCPPQNDKVIEPDPDSIRVEKAEANEVRQTIQVTGIMRIPQCAKNRSEGRSDETADCAFKSVITLYKGKRSIDIHTEIDNRASDHRLRVVFPVGCFADMSQSAGTFSVDSRPVHPEVDPEAMEICKTNMQKDFCDAGNKEYGVAVANRGLREYEAYDEETGTVLAITLLRCTGLISQRRLATRPCKGGWSEKTPDAQCIGTWEFDYSIIPHKGTWEEAEVYVDAHSFNFPMQAIQLDRERPGDQENSSFVRVDSAAMIYTAVKKAEFEETYIVRMYNSTAQKIRTSVHFCDVVKEVAAANLREDTLHAEEMHDHAVEIEAAPFEIVTLKLTL